MDNLILSSEYIKSQEDLASLDVLMKMFEENIKPDGVRNRAYLKINWNRQTDQICPANNQLYFQSVDSNVVDGGKVRQFSMMDENVINLAIMKNIFNKNINIIKEFPALKKYNELVLGLHFIQYRVKKYGASYGTPDYLHVDDEPLVFIHLLNLTNNALGGDNLIADLNTKEVTHVVRLENPLDTLMLTRDYYHAVTALGAREGEARREVLIFTVEPGNTQVEWVVGGAE